MTFPQPSTDSWALITGASQGIGAAIARELAQRGHNVILVARTTEKLDLLSQELGEKYGIEARSYPADLSDHDAVGKLISDMKDIRVDILVNSAGIASFGPLATADQEYESRQFALNAQAVFDLTRAFYLPMVERRCGSICNVGSEAGDSVIPNNATYVFTKAGVNLFTEALHFEAKEHGVGVTLLAPGPVREETKADSEKTIVDRVVPDFLWTTYSSCAAETVEAMIHNKRRVVPGGLAKMMGVLSKITPTAVGSPLIGRFYKKLGE